MTRFKTYDPTLDPDSPFFGQTDEQLAAYWANESAYENARLATIRAERDREELEAKWNWFDAIRRGWAEHGITPKTYTAGSWGPSAAMSLAERDGVSWHDE